MNPVPGCRDFQFANSSNTYFDFHALNGLGVRISNLVTDSRMVKPGDTFLAYAGEKYDARKFIPLAIAAGANAVLWERCGFVWDPAWQAPNLPVAGLRAKAGIIADYVYGHPSHELWLIGITGTNGKTSCSHWIAQAMTALGKRTAIIGTLGTGFPGELELTANTTPDAVYLHRRMADFLRHDTQCVAMEVSSHGIVQERINGLVFTAALFTNLSRDHLDYHDSMEAYADAKARLFHWPGLKYAVLNLDDAFAVELLRQLEDMDIQIIGYGFTELALRMCDSEKFRVARGLNLRSSLDGLDFDVEFEGEHSGFKTGVVGRFNAANLLGVMATLLASGVKLADVVRVSQQICPVAGRMQQMGGGNQPLVVVDYAHTPDALEKVLTTLREMSATELEANAVSKIKNPRLICVFGCGGERDHGKRPLLGAIATRLADEVIITSDNPRRENPHVIISEIAAGAGPNHHIEEDRAAAICRAIQGAHKGDVVLIAGKGHETYQEIDGEKLPFDDAEVARRVLESMMGKMSMPT
jgi:UDP-N-acetylmuramoyl-L-alanyl-D-glutamate--2,6-diaminopimelate ligase